MVVYVYFEINENKILYLILLMDKVLDKIGIGCVYVVVFCKFYNDLVVFKVFNL